MIDIQRIASIDKALSNYMIRVELISQDQEQMGKVLLDISEAKGTPSVEEFAEVNAAMGSGYYLASEALFLTKLDFKQNKPLKVGQKNTDVINLLNEIEDFALKLEKQSKQIIDTNPDDKNRI